MIRNISEIITNILQLKIKVNISNFGTEFGYCVYLPKFTNRYVNFSSILNYTGYSSNGNVVEFFVSPDFVNSNFDKFVFFIK